MSLLIMVLKQVFGNLSVAIRFSLFWILISIPFHIWSISNSLNSSAAINLTDPSMIDRIWSTLVVNLLFTLVLWVVGTSVAINWHRYVLRDEIPAQTFLPSLKNVTFAYMWASLKIGMIVLAITIPAMLLFGLISAVAGGNDFFLILLVLILLGLFLYFIPIVLRMSVILPSIALEKPLIIEEAMELTKDLNGKIFGSIVLFTLSMGVIGGIVQFALVFIISETTTLIILTSIINFILSWFSFFISLGLLTVIYGYAVEKRALSYD